MQQESHEAAHPVDLNPKGFIIRTKIFFCVNLLFICSFYTPS